MKSQYMGETDEFEQDSEKKEEKSVKKQFNLNVPKEKRDKIVSQAQKEVTFAYNYKQSRVSQWNMNEDMYFGRKLYNNETMSNLQLSKMQDFVHTILSKIDSPLDFSYVRGELADLKREKLINALKAKDKKIGRWDTKDLYGKKQAIIYGRAVFFYHATHEEYPGYCSTLENLDVKDFLIDPDAGGIDVENALFLGWGNTRRNKTQLENGAKSGLYYDDTTKELVQGSGNSDQITQQDVDKSNRNVNAGYRMRVMSRSDQYKFYSWITTFEEDGIRYFLLFTDSGQCIQCVPWASINKKSNLYPIWTWAAYPDAFEFWTPAPCDYAREIFLAQSKSINQAIDNSDKINNPQTFVNVDFIKDKTQLKYKKRDAFIEIYGNTDVDKVIMDRKVAAIDTPIRVYQTLDAIVASVTGVTPEIKGTADTELLGVYQGNVQQGTDRFGLYARSYADGYYRFAMLYRHGINWLSKKVAVEIAGPRGLDVEYVSKTDIMTKGRDYDIMIESPADLQISETEKKDKEAFYMGLVGNELINQKVLFQERAKNAGVDDDTVDRLLDPEFDDIELVAEADNIFQKLLAGEPVELYPKANVAFWKRFLALTEKYDPELEDNAKNVVTQYLVDLEPIVYKNQARKMVIARAKAGYIAAEKEPEVPAEPAANPMDPMSPTQPPGSEESLGPVPV